jgi:hypothetical protein
MSQQTQLREWVAQTPSQLQIDEDAGVIRGVRIIGLESANGRTYTREAIRGALRLYEGCPVNIDHPARPGDQTQIHQRLAWLENVRQEPDGGARGDLHYLKSHPTSAIVVEVAKRRPQLMGLSHNAAGQTRREGGREIVEAIDRVDSVDLVADPATVSGLHESRRPAVKKSVKQLIEELKAKRPGYAKGLREQVESGLMTPDQEQEDPGAYGPGDDAAYDEPADHEAALKQGFRGAIMACLDDDGMDLKAKLKKIAEILKTEEKLLGNGEEPEESPTEESRKGRRGKGNLTEQLQLQIQVRDLCADEGVRPDRVLRKALDACTSLQEARELVAAAKQTQAPAVPAPGGQQPRSAPLWTEPAPVGNGPAPVQESRTVMASAETEEQRQRRLAALRGIR